jgi:hypothetical protein
VIVAKRQRRLSGIDDLVISLSSKGLTHGEIERPRVFRTAAFVSCHAACC